MEQERGERREEGEGGTLGIALEAEAEEGEILTYGSERAVPGNQGKESKRGGASKGAVLPRGQVSIGKGPSDLSVGRGLGTIAGVVRSQLDCGVKER